MPQLDKYTKLLMHMDDNTFKDECGHTIINNGVTLDTTNKKFGNGSAYFNGNGGLIKIPNSLDFAFENEDFTIDFWIKLDNLPSTWMNVFRKHPTSGTPFSYGFAISSTGQLGAWLSSDTTTWNIANGTVIATGIMANVWNHIAITRNNGKIYGFVNGIIGTSISTTLSLGSNTTEISIGGHDNCDFVKGYIDELRISKGIARWTNNFIPPINAYNAEKFLIKDDFYYYSMNEKDEIVKYSEQEFKPTKDNILKQGIDNLQLLSTFDKNIKIVENPINIIKNGEKKKISYKLKMGNEKSIRIT